MCLVPGCNKKTARSHIRSDKGMELFKRLIVAEEGQGLVEYTLLIGVLVLALWAAVNFSDVKTQISTLWGKAASQLQ